jgi:plastocyanin
MSRRLLTLLGMAALLVAAFVLAPTVAAGDPCFHAYDNRPAPSTGSTSQITLGDCVFTPTVSRVETGTTVTWRNASIQAHEVVGSNMTWGAHDKLLEPGDTIGWEFKTAGVYAYACMIHPGMSGVIVVGDALASGKAPVAATEATSSGANGNSGPSATTVGLAAGAGGLALGFVVAGLLRRNRAPDA